MGTHACYATLEDGLRAFEQESNGVIDLDAATPNKSSGRKRKNKVNSAKPQAKRARAEVDLTIRNDVDFVRDIFPAAIVLSSSDDDDEPIQNNQQSTPSILVLSDTSSEDENDMIGYYGDPEHR